MGQYFFFFSLENSAACKVSGSGVGIPDLPDREGWCSGLSGSSGPSVPESRLWLSCAIASPDISAKSLHLEKI